MIDKFIPYGRQEILQEDLEAVKAVLESDWLTQGPMIVQFEHAIAAYCQAQHCVAFSSATAALHLACLVLGVGKGDQVWTSPITFVASANCALYCGASVNFVDICAETYNISVPKLEEKLIWAKQHNCLPKVVIPVHFAGQSCDMKAIKKLSDEYGFYIIEDASHAIGGQYLGKPVGSCDYSDMAVFSFHPVKIMTTGEGGAVTTNNPLWDKKLRLLRSHGITRDSELMTITPEGSWYYQQIDLGFNYRITDIQCALGIQQLKRVDQYVAKRNLLVQSYEHKLSDLAIRLPRVSEGVYSAYHLYVVQLDYLNKISRAEVFKYMQDQNIGVNVHYIPVHTQPYYQSLGFKFGDYPLAEHYYANAITLPLYPALTEQEQDHVVESLKQGLCQI